MADRVPVSLSHSARLRAAVERYGASTLASRAATLLVTGDEDAEFLRYLGGRAYSPDLDPYWFQSWGARALEYYWVDSAAPAVIGGLSHQHWRVRMVCARVCVPCGRWGSRSVSRCFSATPTGAFAMPQHGHSAVSESSSTSRGCGHS